METATQSAASLRRQIQETEEQLLKLKKQLAAVETRENSEVECGNGIGGVKWPLKSEEYKRYGRQMIVPDFGVVGQLRLKNSKVLVVGAGGLGCPALAYLAGAGVGTIGIVDGDEVEISNLHRQILHSGDTVGMKKVDSVVLSLRGLNPDLEYQPHPHHLTPSNSLAIMQNYDLVLDCTDNPSTRYLISDTCVLLSLPLISASALRTEGQLLLLNHPHLPPGNMDGGPCYRCVFPKPPPAATIMSCGEGGIFGPVVGVMGVLQALKAIEILVKGEFRDGPKGEVGKTPTMLLFSGLGDQMFRTVRLKGRRKDCFACGEGAGLTRQGLEGGGIDYITFCGLKSPVKILKPEERVSAKRYGEVVKEGKRHLLLDVREKIQFDIASLEGSVNVPMSRWQGKGDVEWLPEDFPKDAPIFVVCRLGNDSQIVARKLLNEGIGEGRWIGDIEGGFKAWREDVDRGWPQY